MRRYFYMLMAAILLFASCAASPDKMVSIYERGAAKAAAVTSKNELYEVSLQVDKEIKSAASGIGSDKKMSSSDTRKVLNARDRYEQAVEQAARRLNYPSRNGSYWAQ